ncbi:MAG: tripartite tricarboxylate transporter permease [Deltaproteobacteria bacterium]|nr:tripartite tricarboxylate transporter permease [Deltaproteobacteria bacterium]
MDFLTAMQLGLFTALEPLNILYCFIGVFVGTLIGVLPGIGPSGAIAILMPVTFNLPSVSAIIILAGIYYGAMYGGSTTSILVNIPGEAASVVTCIDGYQMARKGRAGPALGIAAFGSFIAGISGIIFLAVLAPSLAQIALDFGPPEFFSLMILGLTLVIYLGSASMIKALMMAAFGVVLGCIGQDPILGAPRLTYGIEALFDGVDLIPVIMGLFGISEVLINMEKKEHREIYETEIKGLLPTREDWKQSAMPIARGTVLGFFLGIVPGGGALLASFASYAIEKKFSKHPEKFGTGAIEGVAGPETANNAGTMGAMVPLLTLGIPSNVAMALLLAALMIHGTPPGPMLIESHPELFWGILASMILGNFLLLLLNLPLIGMWVQILKVPYKVLSPLIVMFCLIGAYSVHLNGIDIVIMLFSGGLGYPLKKYEYEAAPLVLAFILGPMMETALRQSLIVSHGNFGIFLERPYSLISLITAGVFLLLPLIPFIQKKKEKLVAEDG